MAKTRGSNAYDVYKDWQNQRRKQAATTIQRHWKGALLRVSDGRKVHRSRVVRKRGQLYNARDMFEALVGWVPNAGMQNLNVVDETDEPVYWPRTNRPMTERNKRRVKSRGGPSREPGHGMWAPMYRDALVRRVLAAYRAGASAFAPYKRNGWIVVHVNKFKHNAYQPHGRPVLFAAKKSWNPYTLQSALQKFLKASYVSAVSLQGPHGKRNLTGQNLSPNDPNMPHFGTTLASQGVNQGSTLNVFSH